jgi:DNA-binding CsgD family transcriptional regulator
VAMDGPGEAWLARLPDDGLRAFGVDVPIAIQSVVNFLSAGGAAPVVSRIADHNGVNVSIRGENLRSVRGSARSLDLAHEVSIEPTSWGIEHPAFSTLTVRQREIAGAVAVGLSDQAVAARFSMGVATVHDHLTRLHRVTGTSSRAELVAALNGA